MKLTPFVLIALMMSFPAHGEQASSAGAGVATCGEFANEYLKNTSVELTYYTWAQGFMTGLNSVVTHKRRDLTSITVDEQMRFLRSYCNKHPLEDYFMGVVELYDKKLSVFKE